MHFRIPEEKVQKVIAEAIESKAIIRRTPQGFFWFYVKEKKHEFAFYVIKFCTIAFCFDSLEDLYISFCNEISSQL